MKTAKRTITGIMMAAVMLTVGSVWAGDLTPPGAPGSTMHTLEEIYQKVEHLGPGQTLSATTTVVEAGYYAGTSLDAIDPDMVASNIRAGVVLFGIAGTYQGSGNQTNPPEGMVLIPAGSFSMGDAFDPEGGSDELPVHSVNISAFYMDATEVTKAEWDAVYTWAVTNGYSFDNAGSGKATDHPVQTVGWYDVVKWCNARSEKEGRSPCYTVGGSVYRTGQSAPDCNWSADGYRLPTEAEWEYAARGGLSGQRFPWGATINHDNANYYANGSDYSYDTSPYTSSTYHPDYDDGGYPYTSPVGSFAANGYGVYDMSGNVWEWCWDWADSSYYSSSPGSDPHGPASGSYRVDRGGSWSYYARHCRVAGRSGNTPVYSGDYLGFRAVLPPGQ